MKNVVVMKFGGTSVSKLDYWKTIVNVAKMKISKGEIPFIVCSAMSGVSNSLERLLKNAKNGSIGNDLSELFNKHKNFARELGVNEAVLDDDLDSLEKIINGIMLVGELTPKSRAKVMSFGELLLTKLAGEFLKKNSINAVWMDAREMLSSNTAKQKNETSKYLHALCEYKKNEQLISTIQNLNCEAIITQGFIAGNELGETVLLGRGGSDVSASYFASMLNSQICEIWTDVAGMFTADPRKIPSARIIKRISYLEAQEIATLGAKVLHPRCLAPVAEANIPLHIKYIEKPDFNGTVVTSDKSISECQIKAISTKKDITVISMDTIEMWQQVGFLAGIFDCFRKYGISVDQISTSETNVTVTLDNLANVLDENVTKKLVGELETFSRVKLVENCALLSIVGQGIRSNLYSISNIFELFEEQKIYLMTQAANDLNLTFVVDEDQEEKLARQLHAEIFKPEVEIECFGPAWEKLFIDESKNKKQPKWWEEKKEKLLKMVENKTPVYVYDLDTINRRIKNLKSITALDKVFYSIKANPNKTIVNECFKNGLGLECVSINEVEHVFETIKDINPSVIMFTPNFAPKYEYEKAFELKVNVTLDNIYPLIHWPEVFRNKKMFVRIDPGHGKGHHKYVKTAGSKSKFGISLDEIEQLIELSKNNKIEIAGLHAHVGSNIFETDTWSDVAKSLISVAKEIESVKVIDLGGGLGVVEKPSQSFLDIESVNKNLEVIKNLAPEYKIWIEPGRFIVAEAGVLISKVTQTKQKGDYYYVGIETGMNSLIRPALYGAYHEIVNLSSKSDEMVTANIVGPICESGDVFGYERRIKKPKDGDVILIATAGAYGRAMSSNYNLRSPAEEMFVE